MRRSTLKLGKDLSGNNGQGGGDSATQEKEVDPRDSQGRTMGSGNKLAAGRGREEGSDLEAGRIRTTLS